jgi:hypothetical protein
MRPLVFMMILFLPFAAACSGGGGGSTPAAPVMAPQYQPEQIQSVVRASGVSISNHLLYIGNSGNNSITVYRHEASGNAPPLYVIAGSRTELVSPIALSEDAQGNLYVANPNSVLVFAHGAHGNVAPLRMLAGPDTGLANIEAITVDQNTGKIFVSEAVSGKGSRLLRFPPNATGNEAPFAASSVSPGESYELASDSTGENVIEANNGIQTLVKQFYPNTAPTGIYSITSFVAVGVADDPPTKTFVASAFGKGIYRFKEDTVGTGGVPTGPVKFTPALVSTIADTCTNTLAVAPGPYAPTYAVHMGFGQGECAVPAIYVYANNASGNSGRLRVLSGSATGLNVPYGIYEGN